MHALQGRNARGVLALALVLALGLLVVGISAAPAATDTTRCGGATSELDPVTGEPVDPNVVVIGVNTPTEGDDVIFGTNGADNINGRGGNDVICGFDGNDTINGGSGNDQVFAGIGDDRVDGGVGDDELNGEDGNDNLNGNEGDDRLFGGNGSDSTDGGQGNDNLFGEGGNDTQVGGAGDDFVFGGDAADRLEGGDGNDQLTGEAGNDTLLGQAGDDHLFGGDGDDDVQGADGLDELSGGAGNDTLSAGGGEDKSFGGDGNDTMDGGAGPDDMAGDAGVDTVHGGAGEDSVAGGDGNDTVDGDDGNDQVAGDAGDDTVRGSDGDDSTFGGNGNDLMIGGNGADGISGGDGIDTADYSGTTGGGITVDLNTGEVTGSAGADTLSGIEIIIGTPFNDELTGNQADNVISGGAGDDTIDGGQGNDTENGDDGNDTFSQSGELRNGADVMNGGIGIDTVDYTSRANPVSVTLDGVANDGEVGEGDNVEPDVEGANVRPNIAPAPAPTPDLTAPALSGFRTTGSRFSPNGDGRRDLFTVTGRFSETTEWTFEILSGSSAVYTDTGTGSSMKASWNGLNSQGRNVASETYRYRISGKDAAGNLLAPRTGTITVDRARPRVRSLSVTRRTISPGRSTQIRFSVNEASRFRVKIKRGSFVRTFGPRTIEEPGSVAVSWNGKTRRGRNAKPGRYRVEVGVRDLAGNLTVRRTTIRVI